MGLDWVDLAILVIIGLSVLTGLIRGFVKELIALCIWALAIWLAYNYSGVFDPWLQKYLQDETARRAVGFVILLVGTLVSGSIFNVLLGYLIKHSGLSGTDRVLGMGFGLVRGVFVVTVLMLIVQLTSLPKETYIKNSTLYAGFQPMVDWLNGMLPDFIQQVRALDKEKKLVVAPVEYSQDEG